MTDTPITPELLTQVGALSSLAQQKRDAASGLLVQAKSLADQAATLAHDADSIAAVSALFSGHGVGEVVTIAPPAPLPPVAPPATVFPAPLPAQISPPDWLIADFPAVNLAQWKRNPPYNKTTGAFTGLNEDIYPLPQAFTWPTGEVVPFNQYPTPMTAARVSGSQAVRNEDREMNVATGKEAYWSLLSGLHRLRAEVAVTAWPTRLSSTGGLPPTSGRVVLGQTHQRKGSNEPGRNVVDGGMPAPKAGREAAQGPNASYLMIDLPVPYVQPDGPFKGQTVKEVGLFYYDSRGNQLRTPLFDHWIWAEEFADGWIQGHAVHNGIYFRTSRFDLRTQYANEPAINGNAYYKIGGYWQGGSKELTNPVPDEIYAGLGNTTVFGREVFHSTALLAA